MLHPLEDGCQRIGVQEQTVPDLLDGELIFFPQDQEDDILGVGKLQFMEEGLVQSGHQARTGVQGKTELVTQFQHILSARRGSFRLFPALVHAATF